VAFWLLVAGLLRLIFWMVERLMSDSQSGRSVLHPDGWVGDPDELGTPLSGHRQVDYRCSLGAPRGLLDAGVR